MYQELKVAKVNVKVFIFILKQLLNKFRKKSFYKGRLFVCTSAYLGHHAHTKGLHTFGFGCLSKAFLAYSMLSFTSKMIVPKSSLPGSSIFTMTSNKLLSQVLQI